MMAAPRCIARGERFAWRGLAGARPELSRRQVPESGTGLLRATTALDRFWRAVDSAGIPAPGELGPGLAFCPARVGDGAASASEMRRFRVASFLASSACVR